MMNMAFELYMVANSVNGKKYIGITSYGVSRRWKRHLASAKRGSEIPLHRAIRKYGTEAFSVETIAESPSYPHLRSAEASDPRLTPKPGARRTADTKKKMSDAKKAFLGKSEAHKQRKNGIPIEHVADVKALLLSGRYTQGVIARRFGIPHAHVWAIKSGICWGGVQPGDLAAAEARFADPSWVPHRIANVMRHVGGAS